MTTATMDKPKTKKKSKKQGNTKAGDSQADEAQAILDQMEAKKNDDECAFC